MTLNLQKKQKSRTESDENDNEDGTFQKKGEKLVD